MKLNSTLSFLPPFTGGKKCLEFPLSPVSRISITFEMKLFETLINGFQPLTIVRKNSTFDVEELLDLHF